MKFNNWSNSSFWLDDDFTSSGTSIFDDLEENTKPKVDLLKLAGYRRAIANFVSIVTGQSIPVQFSGADSYTDGKKVNISSKLNDNEFDPAVGLALHEGSHIKLTDFDITRELSDCKNIPSHLVDMVKDKYFSHLTFEKDSQTEDDKIWLAKEHIVSKMKDLLNIVEDRRIDNFVYKSAPGYRGYYESLYDKYFNAKIVDKGLQSDEYTEANWESYMFRICNITNPNRRLDIMNFKKIWNILDLKNIDRLKSSFDALCVAYRIFEEVESNIPKPKPKEVKDCDGDGQCEKDGGEGFCDNGPHSYETTNKEAKCPEGDAPEDDGSKAKGEKAKKGKELSPRQLQQLAKAIDKQKAFGDGDVKKKKLCKRDQKAIKAMEEAGIDSKDVKYQSKDWHGNFHDRKQEVYIIKNVTQSLIDSEQFPSFFKTWEWKTDDKKLAVKEGLVLGKMLGKKLKVRAEEKNTKFNRLRTGKIDNRMLASCGYGNESIFEKIESFAYNPGIIHISIDNSGSMSGRKLLQAMKTTTAIAKACSMIDNMDVVVSFRAADHVGSNRNMYLPIIATIYDSRKDHLRKLVKIMPQVDSCGTTPEGLCFSAIMNDILEASRGKDAYFLNFSDGMPWFQMYEGEGALNHTRQQVVKMRKEGIKVLSYFIGGEYSSDRNNSDFKKMYGKDAEYVNTNNVISLAKTMNSKFLEVV